MTTDTQAQQLAAAEAQYELLKTREDILYKVYLQLPLDAHPLVVDAARMAYLQASTQTLPALCEVARLQLGK